MQKTVGKNSIDFGQDGIMHILWLTYPLTEIITTITGYVLYRKQLRQMKPAKLG